MKHEIKEYDGNLNIRITFQNGDQYEIRANDKEDMIEVRTVDGRMKILPSVSNVIKVETDK